MVVYCLWNQFSEINKLLLCFPVSMEIFNSSPKFAIIPLRWNIVLSIGELKVHNIINNNK